MQGYCQISQFNIPSDPAVSDEDSLVDYMIISRRSRYRPGLRYQRRGIDDAAQVANFVETETIMRIEVSFFPLCDLLCLFKCDPFREKGKRMYLLIYRFEAQVWISLRSNMISRTD